MTGPRAPGCTPARSLAFVEVRKSVEATTWYDAQLRDVCAGLAVVSFDGVWPDREVPCSAVRARPLHMAIDEATLRPGDAVEVLVAPTPRNPPGWALGRLGTTRAGELHVQIGAKEYPVEPHTLRPVSMEPPLDPMVIVRRAVPVAPELRCWLTTHDARGCLEQVRATAGLGLAGAGTATGGVFLGALSAGGRETSDALLPDAVVLLGPEVATRRGEMLLKVHFMHQREVEAFHARSARKTEFLNGLQQRASGSNAAARTSFKVDADLVGRTVGKGAERLRRAEAEYQVEVRVLDNADDIAARTVIILGNSEHDVARAREALELRMEAYPVDEEREFWIREKAREIAITTGLAHAKWTGRGLQLCGTTQQIENATMLLDNHNEYFGVFQEIGRQQDEIQRSFEALDEAAAAVGLARPRAKRRARSARAASAEGGAGDARQPGSPRRVLNAAAASSEQVQQ